MSPEMFRWHLLHPLRTLKNLRSHPMYPKWAWHRARYGWSPRDTWSLDDYLCRVAAESLTHLRDNAHGHPGGTTPEKWAAQLTRIIEPLEVWGSHWDWDCDVDRDEHIRRYREAQKAWRRLGEVLGNLWD